jgi:hypothetical protein
MKTRIILTFFVCQCLFALSAFAQSRDAGPDRFVGIWVGVKKDASLPKLEITREGNDLRIQAWGKCTPTDCDWGVVPLHLLGDSISARDLPYGFATWDQNFKVSHMVLHLEKGVLIAEDYSIFTDKSGRSNYRSVSRFKRATARE